MAVGDRHLHLLQSLCRPLRPCSPFGVEARPERPELFTDNVGNPSRTPVGHLTANMQQLVSMVCVVTRWVTGQPNGEKNGLLTERTLEGLLIGLV